MALRSFLRRHVLFFAARNRFAALATLRRLRRWLRSAGHRIRCPQRRFFTHKQILALAQPTTALLYGGRRLHDDIRRRAGLRFLLLAPRLGRQLRRWGELAEEHAPTLARIRCDLGGQRYRSGRLVVVGLFVNKHQGLWLAQWRRWHQLTGGRRFRHCWFWRSGGTWCPDAIRFDGRFSSFAFWNTRDELAIDSNLISQLKGSVLKKEKSMGKLPKNSILKIVWN